MAGERLPTKFYEEIDKYLLSYKKQYIKAKKDGDVDEIAADPIPVTLYQEMLRWAIEENNIFVWHWTLQQWGNIARSASIDPLGFHNYWNGQDSIICKYDDSKADKTGEKLAEKNLYANPFDYTQCSWTGLGIYTALNCDALSMHERFFLAKDVKEGTAAKRYCEQLVTVIADHHQEVMNHIRPEHFNPYGLRKGSATFAVSGTTHSPSLPSVARRGEWSQGVVLDVYLHFASAGDHYLGRILACLMPNEAGFATLPPHFNIRDPMQNVHVQKAMTMMYGPIMKNYVGKPNDPTPILTRCLACIIHHVDSLVEVMTKIPGHDFNNLCMLHDKDLIRNLKPLVTTEPTPGVMTTPTGIPPHIELASQVQKILNTTTQLMTEFGKQTEGIIDAVKNAIEEKAWDSGHVTGTRLHELLEQYQKNSLGEVDKRLAGLREDFSKAFGGGGNFKGANTNSQQSGTATQGSGGSRSAANVFTYDGGMYAVPKDFQFPSVKLRQAVRYWLCGLSVASADGSQRVRPFRKLQPQILPNRLRNPFKLNWKPLFEFLSKGDKVIPEYSSAALPTEEEIEDCYRRCVAHLKTHVSYCFKANKDPTSSWNLSTWAVRVTRSSIEKNGTNADKEKLGAATNRNKARGSNQKRKRKEKANPRYLHRQQKRKNRTTSATSDTPTAAPRNTTAATARAAVMTPAPGAGASGLTFESAFGHAQMTQAQQAAP